MLIEPGTASANVIASKGLDLIERGHLEASHFVDGYRGVAAYLCVWTPPEILRAGGYHPVLLKGRQKTSANGNKMCYRVHSVAELIDSAHYLEDLKMIALPDTCQSLLRTAKRVAEMRELRIFCIEEPCTQNDECLRKYVHQLGWLRDYVSDGMTAEEFDRRLVNTVALYSRMREMLMALRGTDIPSDVFYVLTAASTAAPPELVLPLLDLAASQYTGQPAKGPRIMLVGAPCWLDEWEVASMIEQAGASVGADLLCTSGRLSGTVHSQPGSSPFYNVAIEYFNRVPCLPIEPNTRFYEEMEKLIASAEIRGIVYMSPGGCSAYSAEKERLVLQSSVPVFTLDPDFFNATEEIRVASLRSFVTGL
ncbi:MAG: 2-hydroxyacyl-CoA dehydratase family protein [Candidatus Brocadiia bacterium]